MYKRQIGTRSIIFVVFSLRRHLGYFLLQLYLPCVLIVFLSWVGLWLNREATNDRINLGMEDQSGLFVPTSILTWPLGVTTVLTLIFVIIEGKKDLPKVSYVTALDCFLAVCFVFVFSTLFEFALVHYYTKARTGDLNENIRELEDYVIGVSIALRSILRPNDSSPFSRRKTTVLTTTDPIETFIWSIVHQHRKDQRNRKRHRPILFLPVGKISIADRHIPLFKGVH